MTDTNHKHTKKGRHAFSRPFIRSMFKSINVAVLPIGSPTTYTTLHRQKTGKRGGAVGWGTALHAGRSRVRFPMVSLEFFIDISHPAALWPWGRLSLQQKWVPGILPVGKDGRCVGLTTLPPSCADFLETCEPQPPGMGLLYLFYCQEIYLLVYCQIFSIIKKDVDPKQNHNSCTEQVCSVMST